MNTTTLLICSIAGIFGLIIGSFLNVIIYRLPIILKQAWQAECRDFLKLARKKPAKIFNLARPASFCVTCKKELASWHNIPLLSYLALRGKCYYCNKPISWLYPTVELISAVSTIIVANHFGWSPQLIPALILTWTLIPAIFIDLKHQLLPDNFTLPLIWLGLVINIQNIFTTPESAIIGAVSGYLSLWLINFVFKLIRKVPGMGHGDFKLFAVFGAWLGWQILPMLILGAAIGGSIIGITLILRRKHKFAKPLPFGPYLAVSGWLMLLWGHELSQWYLNLII